jgi:hypothetical protein
MSREPETKISDELRAAITAVDALNSWVRSASFRYAMQMRSPRRAIYFLKRCALAAAHEAGLAKHHRVGVIAQCRDCSGTGQFYHFNSDTTFDHCYRCANSGKLILYFVETRIATSSDLWCWPSWTWHTPEDQWPREWRDWLPNEFPRPTGLTTDAPGKDLTPSQVAAHLNTAEEFFPQRPPLRAIHFEYQTEHRDDFDYCLWVGRLNRHCVFCGAENAPVKDDEKSYGSHHLRRGKVEWGAYACPDCKNKEDVWNRFPLPQSLLRDEAVQTWMQRHATEVTT